jgi:hypothetical protein
MKQLEHFTLLSYNKLFVDFYTVGAHTELLTFTQQQYSSRETFSLRACRKEAQGNTVDVDSSAQENVQSKHSIPAFMYIAFNKLHQTNIRQKTVYQSSIL